MDGCRFYDDKIIATFGHGNSNFPNKIVIFSLVSATPMATIDLAKNPKSSAKEMEGCIIYNNKIYLGYNGDSMLYLLSFVKNKTGEIANPISIATTNTDGLMSATDKTMLDTMSSSYVLNPNLQPPIMAVDPLFSVFRTIGIIGDSYSSGSIYYWNNSQHTSYTGLANQNSLSWGKQLGRIYGDSDKSRNVMIYAQGGWTAKEWFTESGSGKSWSKFNRDIQPRNTTTGEGGRAKDLYILAFGINDYREIVIDNSSDPSYTWGDVNNIKNYSNITNSGATNYYLNAPNTFFGVHNKIIRNIKKWSPDSIIVMLSYLRNDQEYEPNAKSTTNKKLQAIANEFSNDVVFINVDDDPFFSSDFYTKYAYINHHPTAIGYAGMATAIARLIGKAMRQHPEKFLTVGKISEPDYIYDVVVSS